MPGEAIYGRAPPRQSPGPQLEHAVTCGMLRRFFTLTVHRSVSRVVNLVRPGQTDGRTSYFEKQPSARHSSSVTVMKRNCRDLLTSADLLTLLGIPLRRRRGGYDP